MSPTERLEQIRELYEARVPVKEIGRRFGVSGKHVSRIVGRLGVRRAAPEEKWSEVVLDDIAAMREAGVTWTAIGVKYEVTATRAMGVFSERGRSQPVVSDWLPPSMTDDQFVARLRAEGGHSVCQEVMLARNRYGAVLFRQDRIIPVVSSGVMMRMAA
jgi:hypothetical protein